MSIRKLCMILSVTILIITITACAQETPQPAGTQMPSVSEAASINQEGEQPLEASPAIAEPEPLAGSAIGNTGESDSFVESANPGQNDPQQEAAEQNDPQQEVAEQNDPQQNAAEQNDPQQEVAEQNDPQQEVAEQNDPQQEVAEQNDPQQEVAEQNDPQQNAAEQNDPQQEVAEQNDPQQENAGQASSKMDASPVVPDGTKVAYITIDDGPSRNITPGILDVLAEEGIKATFFVLPHSGLDDIYQRIIDEGHELANHSYSHVYSKLYNSSDMTFFKEDAIAARDFIYDRFGYTTTAYRFPGGAMGKKDSIIAPRREFLAEIGYRAFDWDLTTGDADKTGLGKDVSVHVSNVIDNIRGRDKIIILMHDTSDKKTTLEALPIIITELRALGYTFDLIQNYP